MGKQNGPVYVRGVGNCCARGWSDIGGGCSQTDFEGNVDQYITHTDYVVNL